MDLGFWRDLAVVWLALLCFIGLVVPLGLAFFAVKGMHVAVSRVPGWMHQAQDVSHNVRTNTERIADRVAEPIIATDRRVTRLGQLMQRLVRGRPRSQ